MNCTTIFYRALVLYDDHVRRLYPELRERVCQCGLVTNVEDGGYHVQPRPGSNRREGTEGLGDKFWLRWRPPSDGRLHQRLDSDQRREWGMCITRGRHNFTLTRTAHASHFMFTNHSENHDQKTHILPLLPLHHILTSPRQFHLVHTATSFTKAYQ